LGRRRDAIDACRRAVASAPQQAESQRLLGELLEAAGDMAEAVTCYRRAAAVASSSGARRFDLVRALFLQNNLVEARRRR
jgi:tetratricopeptide (TPR) repeat protein